MIISIQNNNLSAKIDTLGAQLISLKDHRNTEYIWQRNPSVWKNCSPILFPIVGNCRDNKTVIQGRTYEIPKHGPCKTTEFHLSEHSGASAVFSITEKDFPENCYPYPFQLHAGYTLTDHSLQLTLTVSNVSKESVYYCIGLHPGIRCPLYEGEAFEDYVLRFGKNQESGYRRYDTEKLEFDMTREYPFPGAQTDIPLSHDLFLHDAIWFDRPSSKEVALINPSTGHGIATAFEDFDTVAFWTGTSRDAEFLCIEPWNGSAACSDEDQELIHKNHLQELLPDSSRSYTMKFTVL